jgi:hypothetical protein
MEGKENMTTDFPEDGCQIPLHIALSMDILTI